MSTPDTATPHAAAAAAEMARTQASADGAPMAWWVHRPPGASGVPLLLLHGLASNASRFEEFVAHTTLVRQHVLIRVDLRGHGRALTRRRTDIQAWCQDLQALLQAELGSTPVLLVGHSLGAQVALQLAQAAPQRVAGLVLIDPVFRSALHGAARRRAQAAPLLALLAAAARGLNALGLHRGALPPLDLRALDEAARRALASPEQTAAFIAQYSSTRADLRHVPTAVYLQDVVEMFRPAPLPRDLGLPTLALLSTGATFADAGEMRRLLAGPQVSVQAVHCHHWPLTEKPREVRQAVEDWVTGPFAAAQDRSPST